jgi:signal transduction histidine kinase
VLDNALRVSPAGGEVAVSLTAHRRQAAIAVRDHGPGIEPGALARIFDRFYSRSQLTGEHAGSGLGLAIARAIARDHGGELTARNNPDGGASLIATLPLSAKAPARVAAAVTAGADALDA